MAAEELRDNPGQWQAFESKGNCVVLAGPGSGKTKTLTLKLARVLAENVRPPRGVACITYSNECVREIRRRLKKLGIDERKNVFIGTVHSFCLRHVLAPYARLAGIAVPHPLTVARQAEQNVLFERALAEIVSSDERPSDWRIPMDRYRRMHIDRGAPEWQQEDVQLAQLVERYEYLLRERGLIDFDDMTLGGTRLIVEHDWVRRAVRARFPVLVIDEYQDLGVPLDHIVRCLCFQTGIRLIAVGDPDQSIYGYTGARPELLRDLAAQPGVECVTLGFNYRCARSIVRASEVALGEARGYQARRTQRGLIDWHERPGGLEDQAQFVCCELVPAIRQRLSVNLGDVAVLYRTKHDGDVIAAAADSAGAPYARNDGNSAVPRTPLTRWLEECASWCAGGWRKGEPPLSWLVRLWLGMNPTLNAGLDRTNAKRNLVRTLLLLRQPGMPLAEWVGAMRQEVCQPAFEREPTLRQEAVDFAKLVENAGPAGKLKGLAIEVFAGQAGTPKHLNLITLHSAKGLEFEAVVVLGMDQGNIPPANTGRGTAEDRRLFYVALTRAKREFHMLYSGWCLDYRKRVREWGPSEYLEQVRRLAQGGTSPA
jgi:DNA helicase-2/ATP-dependent DNA helicase PcrA